MREMGVDDQEDCDIGLGLGMSISTGGHYNSHPVQLDLLPFAPVSRDLASAGTFRWEKSPTGKYKLSCTGIREVKKACSRLSGEEEEGGGGGTRKKLRLSKDQSDLLEERFKENSTLNPKEKLALAKQLDLRPRQVEVWFQNRRARTKLKQNEMDCELLRRCYDSLIDDNRRLQRELAELRALKMATASPVYMQLPAATLTMCPSCQRVITSEHLSPFTSLQKPHLYPSHSSTTC